jgi:hypothetical protein
MRCARTIFPCVLGMLALSGGMGRPRPVAATPAAGSLDIMTHGQTAARRTPVAAPARINEPDDHLDAGYRLRVPVYGQEGLTETCAIGVDRAVTLCHLILKESRHAMVPLSTPFSSGDTVLIDERWL